MADKVDPQEFWDRKISGWEDGRYETSAPATTWLEKIADWSSASLRFRMAVTHSLLAPHVKGRRVVELGCGSGLLAPKLLAAGALSYQGYDISPVAIDRARARIRGKDVGHTAHFDVAAIDALAPFEADLVFSLGLFDWLSDRDLQRVFELSRGADFHHAISEKRVSLSQFLHRLYVHVAYGHRTGGYVPRYFSVDQIEAAARPFTNKPLHVFRHRRLSFGAFVTTIPFAEGQFDGE
jgi:SAM-dependent methyltransferase